jgi:hypothetical protein
VRFRQCFQRERHDQARLPMHRRAQLKHGSLDRCRLPKRGLPANLPGQGRYASEANPEVQLAFRVENLQRFRILAFGNLSFTGLNLL